MNTQLAEMVWDSRYRLVRNHVAVEKGIDATWARVARAVAGVEANAARGAVGHGTIFAQKCVGTGVCCPSSDPPDHDAVCSATAGSSLQRVCGALTGA